jgi:hypothetical protein
MILMICGTCQLDMMVVDTQYVPSRNFNNYLRIYHVKCENNHKSKISGEIINMPNRDQAESRVIHYLIERSEKIYGKTYCN